MNMRKKICFVVAIPGTAESFLRDHILSLMDDYDIYLVSNIKNKKDVEFLHITGFHSIEIHRAISIVKDLKAVYRLWRYFRSQKFDAIHSVTPKAGLIAALAGFFAKIPHRTHIFTGQVWATKKGISRWLLRLIDKLIAKLDNHILVDGKSQRDFLRQQHVLKDDQGIVFGKGSISGVNATRFKPDYSLRQEIRKEIGISESTLVFTFLGRLNHDKGIGELFSAFNHLAKEYGNVFLLLIGTDEEGYIKTLPNYQNIIPKKNFYYYGRTSTPEKVLNAGDIFTLPTYREGFGTSVLEAACMGLPAICSDAYGVVDAMIENETGLRCHVGDVESLYQCMKRFCDNPALIKELGDNAQKRAINDFNGNTLTQYWVNFYHQILSPDSSY